MNINVNLTAEEILSALFADNNKGLYKLKDALDKLNKPVISIRQKYAKRPYPRTPPTKTLMEVLGVLKKDTIEFEDTKKESEPTIETKNNPLSPKKGYKICRICGREFKYNGPAQLDCDACKSMKKLKEKYGDEEPVIKPAKRSGNSDFCLNLTNQ
jgi:hypothetical protein